MIYARLRAWSLALAIVLAWAAPAAAIDYELQLNTTGGVCNPDNDVSCVRYNGDSVLFPFGTVFTVEADFDAQAGNEVPVSFQTLFIPDVPIALGDRIEIDADPLATGTWNVASGEIAIDNWPVSFPNVALGGANLLLDMTTESLGSNLACNQVIPPMAGMRPPGDVVEPGKVILVGRGCVFAPGTNEGFFVVLAGDFVRGPGTCGDGEVGPTEQCDDGNMVGGDGCSAACTTEGCGNGVTDVGEQCDDGNTASGDGCSSICTAEICGSGVLEFGEECDDGNTVGGDGCSATCQIEECGNEVLDVGEQCDDGNTVGGDACSAVCLFEICGNGFVDVGEQCDDGDTSSGDGCSKTCVLEVADLVISAVEGPAAINPGESATLRATVSNVGIFAAVPAPIPVQLSVASGSVAKPGDPVVGECTVDAIGPGNNKTCEVEIVVPGNIEGANTRWAACVDPGNQVVEASDDNNCSAGSTVLIPEPALPFLVLAAAAALRALGSRRRRGRPAHYESI